MRMLRGVYDGDTGGIYRFQFKDQGAVYDLNSASVEFAICDEDGALIARRPGLPVSPKTDGLVDLVLLGKEADLDGLGGGRVIKPKVYAAVSPTGAAATNLLLNPSFDTDTTPANGIADSWVLVNAQQATYTVLTDDPWPSAIFGGVQSIVHGSLGQTDKFEQVVSISGAIGDRYSVGVWHRATGGAEAANDQHAIEFRTNDGVDNVLTRLTIGQVDWYFVRLSTLFTTVKTSATLRLVTEGTTATNRFDDAFLFKGDWREIPVEPLRILIHPRKRVAKSSSQIQGWGSFEEDSNADGIPDGWAVVTGTNSYALDPIPANVAHGSKSLKVTLAAAAGKTLSAVHRGNFKTGEVWRASVKVKTSGALIGSPSAGQWAIQLVTQPFDGGGTTSQAGSVADFGTNLATFTTYQSDLTLTSDVNALRIVLNLNGVTGTAWLDDVQLVRVSP